MNTPTNKTSIMSEQEGSWLAGDDNATSATSGSRPYPNGLQVAVMWVIPSLMVAFNVPVFVVAPRMKSSRPCVAKMGYGMLSLATTDFSLGILLLIKIAYMSHIDFTLDESNPMCTVIGYGKTVVSVVSILTLTFLSVDRLLMLAAPLRYGRYLTRRRVKLIHAAIWLFVTAALAGTVAAGAGRIRYYENSFGCIPDWSESLVRSILTLVLIHVLPALVISACFVGVFHIARRTGARNRRLKGGGSAIHRGKTGDSRRLRDLRIFRSLAIMTFGRFGNCCKQWCITFAIFVIN